MASSVAGRRARLTQANIRRFRQEGKDDCLSDVRLNRYVATLRAMFRQAAKDEIITTKEMPAYFPMVKERNEGRGAIFIQPEWYTALRKVLSEPLRSAFTLAYHLGIRAGGELKKLRWRHFDVRKRIVTLPGEIIKTEAPRVVFLPKDFDRKPGKPDEVVFPLGDIRDEWRAATVKVGAGYYECRECGARCEGRVCPETVTARNAVPRPPTPSHPSYRSPQPNRRGTGSRSRQSYYRPPDRFGFFALQHREGKGRGSRPEGAREVSPETEVRRRGGPYRSRTDCCLKWPFLLKKMEYSPSRAASFFESVSDSRAGPQNTLSGIPFSSGLISICVNLRRVNRTCRS